MCARLSAIVVGMGLVALAGCLSPVQQQTDALVCSRARIPLDFLPPPLPAEQLPTPKATDKLNGEPLGSGLQQVSGVIQQLDQLPSDKEGQELLMKQAQLFLKRLEVRPGVPGAEALPVIRPKDFEKLPPAEQDKVLARYFPPMLPMGPDPRPSPGPEGRPLTLEDLRSEEHTSELQSRQYLVCRLLLEKKN